MVEVAPARAIAFERTMAPERRHLSLRIGVAAAVASVGPSLARGLLPRTATDQAMVTGATAAYALGFSALGQSVVESVADVIVRRRHGGNPEYVVLAASAIVGAAAAVVRAAVLDDHTVALPLATAQSGARVVSAGALAGALVVGSDLVLDRTMGPRGLPVSLAVAGVIGAGAGAVQIARQRRRARRHAGKPATGAQAWRREALRPSRLPIGGCRRRGGRRARRGGGGPVRDRGGHHDPDCEAAGPATRPRSADRRSRRGGVGADPDRSGRAQPGAAARDACRRHRRAGLPRRADEPTRDRGARQRRGVRLDRQGGPALRPDDPDPRADRRGDGRAGEVAGARGCRVRQRLDEHGAGQDRVGRVRATRWLSSAH